MQYPNPVIQQIWYHGKLAEIWYVKCDSQKKSWKKKESHDVQDEILRGGSWHLQRAWKVFLTAYNKSSCKNKQLMMHNTVRLNISRVILYYGGDHVLRWRWTGIHYNCVCVCVVWGWGGFFRDQLTLKNRQKSLFALRQTLLSFNRDSEGFVTLRQRL